MKRIIIYLLCLLLIWCLLSCSSSKDYNVKLLNGSIVKAEDEFDRGYISGDTVCVKKGNRYHWLITNSGIMADSADMLYEYRIGIIK